jgi:hypothetical protein
MIKLQWDETATGFLHEDIPGSENMVPVFSIHNGEHDWKRMLALFSPETKKFHWMSGAGCACCEENSSHVRSVRDLTSGDERALKQALCSFLTDAPNVVSEEEKQKIFSKVKKQK